MPYTIITDSVCDIPRETLTEWGVRTIPVVFSSSDGTEYLDYDLPSEEFYRKMRDGVVFQTAATNTARYMEAFEAVLKEGSDVLYLGFSSGLSSMYQSSVMAAEELRETYPDRKIITMDMLAASGGLGFIVYLAVKKQQSGASMTEVADYVRECLPHLCHWFTVDDLMFLHRGGRVSKTAAIAGTLLGIKPVLHVDDEGHLIPMEKVRGRGRAIATLAEKYLQTAKPQGGEYFISHGDCLEEAQKLAAMIQEKSGVECTKLTTIGPVIGAHSGPGTIALFFLGEQR